MELKYFLALFLRRLPYFLLVAVGISVTGLAVALVLPPVYVADARLLVESEQIPDNLAASTVQTQATEQLQIIESRIMTRANLLDMANRFGVYEGQPPRPADEIVTDMRQRTTITRISGGRNTDAATLVRVAFEAPTPELSSQVTNEFVTLILEANVTLRTAVAGQTLEFFKQQVSRLDQELSERRRRILEFQQQNQDALSDSLDFRRAQQATTQERLLQLERDVVALNDRRARLVALHDRTGRVTLAADQMSPEERQLRSAEDELAAALAIYSPTHPQIRLLENRVALLQSRFAAASAAGTAEAEDLTVFDVQLADIDAELAFVNDQRDQLQRELAILQSTIEATPGNAIQLETLERDYDNLRIQYDQAVSNRARAETGDLIETLSKGERISVVEQAVPPSSPTSPNRRLIAASSTGLGLLAGFALVVLLELLNRSIRRPVEITNKLGITPFAVLPYIRSRAEVRRRAALTVIVLSLVATGIPAMLWGINTYYMPLDLLIDDIVARLGLAPLIAQIGQYL